MEFVTNRKILLGENQLSTLPSILREKNFKKVFMVVFNQEVPFVKEVLSDLKDSGIEYEIYDEVNAEPDLHVIDNGVKKCKEENCDCVVAIGGGSVIDASKSIAMIVTNGSEVEDYQLHGKEIKEDPLFFIAVPTTAGTGAEATKVSVVYNNKKQWKKALYSNKMIAQIAILDPITTASLPSNITAFTGMDAITHAIESYVSNNATVISRMYSLYALKILNENIEKACKEPENIEARENMLFGSYLAGCAISAGTCLAHIIGQPVGAIYHIPHGAVCSIFLAPTMKINKDFALDDYVEIAKTLGIETYNREPSEIVDDAINYIDELCKKIGAPTSLKEYVSRDEFNMDEVLENIKGSMGHIKTNPRKFDDEVLKETINMVL